MFAQSHCKKGVARYLLLFAKTDILFLENRIHYDLLVRQGPACLCVPGERMTGVAVAAVMSEIFRYRPNNQNNNNNIISGSGSREPVTPASGG